MTRIRDRIPDHDWQRLIAAIQTNNELEMEREVEKLARAIAKRKPRRPAERTTHVN